MYKTTDKKSILWILSAVFAVIALVIALTTALPLTFAKYNEQVVSLKNGVLGEDGKYHMEFTADIFRDVYNNGKVKSLGKKIVAPGTSNDYYFRIKNDCGCTMLTEVTVSAAAYIDNDRPVPIVGRVVRSKEDLSAWNPINDFATYRDSRELGNGVETTYIIQWQWPFEGDDRLDTELGRSDLKLAVEIRINGEQVSFEPDPWKREVTPEHNYSDPGSRVSVHRYDRPLERDPDMRPAGRITTGGHWVCNDKVLRHWVYYVNNYQILGEGWYLIGNPYSSRTDAAQWFYFDENGTMRYGWVKGPGSIWYYCHGESDGDLGSLDYGWHHDPDDGKWYYLDLYSGVMHYGWDLIDGKWYYFAHYAEIPAPTWFDTLLGKVRGTAIYRWIYPVAGKRSFGSMYDNEMTPDGCFCSVGGECQKFVPGRTYWYGTDGYTNVYKAFR